MTKEQFKKIINQKRRANKNRWVTGVEIVNGVSVSYKFYNTSIETLRVNGVDFSGPYDCKVSVFNETIDNALNSIQGG